jgi:hypothetical protein
MVVFTDSQYWAAVVMQAKSIFLGFAQNDKIRVFANVISQTPFQRTHSRVESPLFLKIVGGFRRALSEWRAPSFALITEYISPRVAQPPISFRKSGNRALLRGAYLPNEIGFAFFWLLFLANQEK